MIPASVHLSLSFTMRGPPLSPVQGDLSSSPPKQSQLLEVAEFSIKEQSVVIGTDNF